MQDVFVPLCAFPLASERLERGCGVLKMHASSESVAWLLHITQLHRIMISCPWMLSQLPPWSRRYQEGWTLTCSCGRLFSGHDAFWWVREQYELKEEIHMTFPGRCFPQKCMYWLRNLPHSHQIDEETYFVWTRYPFTWSSNTQSTASPDLRILPTNTFREFTHTSLTWLKFHAGFLAELFH